MFGIGLEKSPVCNTGLAEEQKEFPAVTGGKTAPLTLTGAVFVSEFLYFYSWATYPIQHPGPRTSSGIK